MKGTLNTCLKDRYTLIEQSDLNILIEQSQYSSEEQCSKLIDKEMWLVMGSYCHCQQVVTFFFFFGLQLTTWVKGPTLTLCPGPLNFSGRPWHKRIVIAPVRDILYCIIANNFYLVMLPIEQLMYFRPP